MNSSNLIIKDYMWSLIKDACSCVLEKIELFAKKERPFSKGFTLYYNSENFPRCQRKTQIIFEVFFSNEDVGSACVEKFSDREVFLKIYLPSVFNKKTQYHALTRQEAKEILSNKEEYIPNLIRVIAHEITHIFDPLFHNIFYIDYYLKKHRLVLSNTNDSMSNKVLLEKYYDSVLEKRAYFAEAESLVRLFRNQNKTQEQALDYFFPESYKPSEFELFLKENRPNEWDGYISSVRELISLFYSDEKYLFI